MASDDAFPEDKQQMMESINRFMNDSVPHNHTLGLSVVDLGAAEATMRLPYSENLVGNPETGVLHGGAVTTLIDATCGISVFMKMARMARIATLDLRIDYLHPATPGKDLLARAECYKLTRAVAFVRALAHHGDPNNPVASAQGTFIIVED
ncbi:PaaI family thioesterase [Archangium lansingense]|uniref:PaaI family thioesterase n=1 Tax=Archangium lansingense TaxID=2995310 RepID=A0ABT4APT2_9BACT|nr:PaaI family thioesterase [Archangium lansinium]MCY1083705.1 PaaI family thioesterase [Archangium lansinium]